MEVATATVADTSSTKFPMENLITKTFEVATADDDHNNNNNNNNNHLQFNGIKCKIATASLESIDKQNDVGVVAVDDDDGGRQHHERFHSIPMRTEHEKFLRDCIEIILNVAVFDDTQREKKVLEWHQPDELHKLFDMQLKANSDCDAKLLSLLKDTIRYSVKTGHPYFVNQLFSSVDPYALAGQWLTDALNPSVYTYEVSPVFVLMEEIVLREMRSIIGWTNCNGDGLFAPGKMNTIPESKTFMKTILSFRIRWINIECICN